MSRTKAREIALHLIFEMGFHEFESDEIILERLDDNIMKSISGDIALYAGKLNEKQVQYILFVVKGVAEHLSELDAKIEKYSRGWNINRISRISTAILRLALFEMRYVEDVPLGVAINEAIELAKEYDCSEAAGFVNGILGTVGREQDE